MACPMTNEEADKNGLTEKQVEAFCSKGCSVDCEKFLDEYIKRIQKKRDR